MSPPKCVSPSLKLLLGLVYIQHFIRSFCRRVVHSYLSFSCGSVAYPGGVLGCSSTPLSRRVAEELCANDCRASVTVNGLVNVQARLLHFSKA